MISRLKILFYIFIVTTFVNCGSGKDTFTQKKLFDFNWKFFQGDIENAHQVNFADDDWRTVDLPHNWNKDNEIYKDIPAGLTVGFPSETGWYRKHFEIPQNWIEKRIQINFDGISNQNEIFVNGISVTDSQKENDSFQTTLNPYLNYKGNNVIAIRVIIPQKIENTRQPELGIYKHVWLVIKDSPKFKN